MSSSDDDVPIAQRNQAFLFGKTKPIVLSSDGDSPLPSWLENNNSPAKDADAGLIDSDSESDANEVISPIKLLAPSVKQQQQRNPTPPADDNNDGPSSSSPKKKTIKKPTPLQRKAVVKSPAAAAARGGDDGAGPSQPPTQPPTQPSLATAPKSTLTKPPKSFLGGLPVASETLPVIIPDKLTQLKILIELESTEEIHGATDLSGDSGAIGRVVVKGKSGAQQLQLDLKGVLYNATIVPCPLTMAIVNIGQTEAKVESFFSEVVQLREDALFAEEMGIGSLMGVGDDEDEHYGAGEQEDGAAGRKESGAGAKKKKKGGGGGGGARKSAATAAKKPRGGGVKKTTGAAKGKGRAKK